MSEIKEGPKKELAVIFQRKEQKGKPTMFIPKKIVIGRLDENNVNFKDINGNVYHHTIIKGYKYGFGLRVAIKDLNQLYKVDNLRELMHIYFNQLKEYYYYYMVEDMNIKAPTLNDLVFASEDKKYHTILPLEDQDFETIKRQNNPEIDTVSLIQSIKNKVIGQDDAIENIVSIIWQNSKSKRKSNILIIGPTGVGKTEIIRIIAEQLKVPIIIVNVPSLTKSAYQGENIADILKNLVNKCNGNIEKAENSIIVLDEIDKIMEPKNSEDVISTTGVQDELLKLIEDGEYQLELGDEYWRSNKVNINTKNMTFIGLGSFEEIYKNQKSMIIEDFNRKLTEKDILGNSSVSITSTDLIKYGLKSELVGRMPNIIQLNSLTKDDLIHIMKNPCNDTLNEKIKILNDVGITFHISEDVYEELAKRAIEKKTGARSLVSTIDSLFTKAMLEISQNGNNYSDLIITRETIDNPRHYKLIRKKKEK